LIDKRHKFLRRVADRVELDLDLVDFVVVDLISDALPFARLWHTKPDDAIEYAKFYSRSHDAVIRVYE
jgi:hypothetical protein